MNRSIIILVGIVFLGFFLRFTHLGVIPVGFTADEASQGYSAYSLLKTGRDEWGLSWPVTSFRAFADYRAPLQTYLIIPSIAIFGLNEFAVRLPSAIFGTLSIIAIFLLTNLLFPTLKKGFLSVGHLSALMMAISPWSIQFSRTALEANFASFLFPLGLYLFILGLNKNYKFLIVSAFVFGINMYSYLAAKLFVPLFIFCLLIFYYKKINRKILITFIAILVIFAAPLYIDAFFGEGNTRGKDLIITNLSYASQSSISDEQYLSPLNNISPVATRIFSNKATFIAKQFITNYISYLSPTFWFSEGGSEITYSVFPGFGLLHLFMFPLVLAAIYLLNKTRPKIIVILLAWFLIGIIPAAITKDGYRPNRVGSLLGLLEMISGVGFVYILNTIPKKWQKISSILICFIIFVSLASYLNLYFFSSRVKYPDALLYGYRELMQKIDKVSPSYNKIIFQKGSQSQAFVAFYNKIDPTEFQSYSKEWWPKVKSQNLLFLDMLGHYSLGKYSFTSIDKSRDLVKGNLLVMPRNDYNDNLKPYIVDTVKDIFDKPIFYLLSYDQN